MRSAAASVGASGDHAAARPEARHGHDRRGDHDRDDGRGVVEHRQCRRRPRRDEIYAELRQSRDENEWCKEREKCCRQEQPEHVPEIPPSVS